MKLHFQLYGDSIHTVYNYHHIYRNLASQLQLITSTGTSSHNCNFHPLTVHQKQVHVNERSSLKPTSCFFFLALSPSNSKSPASFWSTWTYLLVQALQPRGQRKRRPWNFGVTCSDVSYTNRLHVFSLCFSCP